jgi:hypothetical protein
MLPKEIVEKFAYDVRYALGSGEARACGSKIRYDNMVAATKAAYNLEVKRPGEILDPYPCPWCGFYHVGHRPPKRSWGYKFGKWLKSWIPRFSATKQQRP